jgi:hypothetical protein
VRALRLVRYLSGPTLVIGLVGCTVGPNYQSPEVREESRRPASGEENLPSRTVEGAVDITWWKSFRDSQLSSLVGKLVAQNLDLKTAAERVLQSVAQRQVAVSQGLPHIEGQDVGLAVCKGMHAPMGEPRPDGSCRLPWAKRSAHRAQALTNKL